MTINEPLSYYTDDNSFRFYIFDVGEGLMVVLIFPDTTTMVFDCNITEENEGKIINELKTIVPIKSNPETNDDEQRIDIFVNSHRDDDHLRGLDKLNKEFKIKSIWDSGQTGDGTESSDYEYYMGLKNRLSKDNKVVEPKPSAQPIEIIGNAKVYCLSSKRDYDYIKDIDKYNLKMQHTNSIVLKISYQGKSLLLTGDSDWFVWKEKVIPNYKDLVKSNILVASHHGSRSFFTSEENDDIDIDANPETTYLEAVEYIKPDIVIIPCGNYETLHHPNKDALEIYQNASENKQVYTTKAWGSFCGYIDSSSNYTVAPMLFYKSRNISSIRKINISCKYESITEDKKSTITVNNGDVLKIGGLLRFELMAENCLINNFVENVTIHWQVSNGGIKDDSCHQEIYNKGIGEDDGIFRFSRALSYEGTHLLRCHFYNKQYGHAVMMFVVKGIK